jgi:hypothetical protein
MAHYQFGAGNAMTIIYSDGRRVEAVILTQAENEMRVAPRDAEDALTLTDRNGRWFTDDCEPVQIAYAWEKRAPQIPDEQDCVCSRELLDELLRRLHLGDDDAFENRVPIRADGRTTLIHVV